MFDSSQHGIKFLMHFLLEYQILKLIITNINMVFVMG